MVSTVAVGCEDTCVVRKGGARTALQDATAFACHREAYMAAIVLRHACKARGRADASAALLRGRPGVPDHPP